MEQNIRICGMLSGRCVKKVTAALQKVPGVTEVRVSLELGQAAVTGTADYDSLVKAVAELGYIVLV